MMGGPRGSPLLLGRTSMIGRTLSHYQIVEEISRGGMGIVYRAVDVNLGREVALKVLPEDFVHDAGRRERLLHEARAASALEHPHIAVIHEVGEADGVTFIAMELIRGSKMSDLVAAGPLPPGRALALATEIAEGLARAHDVGIIHRDLKPANVMISDDGHAKIIDFGLAKQVEGGVEQTLTVSAPGPHTEPGMIVGTAAYMAPEQARGLRIDHRTDIFALGVTLYEMLAGRPAFQGQSNLDTLQAVLSRPVPPLPATSTLRADASAELQRIIAKATAKEADDRYQGVKDLIVDLRAARRMLESTETPAAPTATAPWLTWFAREGRLRGVVAVAAVAVLVAAAVLAWRARTPPPATAPSGKPAVAILYFENNTGDASLDWMRTGLTDMLVTDLSQSTEFEVVGTDRLVQILQDLKREDEKVVSADLVREVAERAGVDNVLLGSYVRAGGTIRINARLQDARTGRVVTAERVDAPGEGNLFAIVDELTRRFKARLAGAAAVARKGLFERPETTPAAEAGLDRGLTAITTSSIEAYRYYADGLHFHERGLSAQAAPLLEKAIAIDPNFAMAYAKLAVVHSNLRSGKIDEYAKRALQLTDRLSARERYYIEGFYYSLRSDTVQRSIEAYQQGLKLHPEHQASRHNLALRFLELGRFAEAIEHYEELRRRGVSNPTSYQNLAGALISTGEIRRAREVADQFVARNPDSAVGQRILGTVAIAEKRYDDARAAYQRAVALNPDDVNSQFGIAAVAFLQGQWNEVESSAEALSRASNAFPRFLASIVRASREVVRGQGQAALGFYERAVAVPGLPPEQRAAARNRMAHQLLHEGKPDVALAQTTLALQDARGREGEFEALQLLSVQQAAAGRAAESEKALAELETLAKKLPSDREIMRVRWARGSIALLRGDAAVAADELSAAVAALPPNGPPNGPPSRHGNLWYDGAVAYLAAGRNAEAARLLERLQTGHERVFAAEAWARSFFLLGRAYERLGDTARAREQYARFVELWGEGDLQRDWVAEARQKLR